MIDAKMIVNTKKNTPFDIIYQIRYAAGDNNIPALFIY